MRSNYHFWLCALTNLIGIALATPLRSPATTALDSNFPYTYTPIYYTAEDLATSSLPANPTDPAISPASPDLPSSSSSSSHTSLNPHAKRFWPFDGGFWKEFHWPSDAPVPQPGRLNCPAMLQACYQAVDQVRDRPLDKYPHRSCKEMLCAQSKRDCGYYVGMWC